MIVLVTDGENRSALAVTRSLGSKGNRVIVTGESHQTLAAASKHCYKGLAVPNPFQDGTAYVKTIGEITEKEGVQFIFPVTELSIYLLNSARDQLPKSVILACPSQDIMRAVSDKSALFNLAQQVHVAIPQTLYLSCPDDLPKMREEIDHYPVVVKPSLSKILEGKYFVSTTVQYASCWEDLQQLYATSKALKYPSMIQEKIVGPGTGLFTLYDKKRHLALFSHKRLREKPPSGGVSVVSESVPLDDEMVVAADRLLSAVGFTGVAMVEFKRDRRDGRAKLMEINGRFWGSLQLAIACGVDFPGLYLDYIQGHTPKHRIGDYKIGHKLKWFLGTLDHLFIRLKNDAAFLNLPDDSPATWRTIYEFLKIWERGCSFDVANSRDLNPFFHEATKYLKVMVERR